MITEEEKRTQVIISSIARKCEEHADEFTLEVYGGSLEDIPEIIKRKIIVYEVMYRIQQDSMSN